MNEVVIESLGAGVLDASIVIPTFNRVEALLQTIECLERLDYPSAKWEAIIVDDGSSDSTGQTISNLIAGTANIRFVRQENRGAAAARNLGASLARGSVLVFIDNDILIEPDFLTRHLSTIAANPECWIVGRVVHPDELRRTPFGRYRDWLWEGFHCAAHSDEVQETEGITAANLSLPARDFRRFVGFDERFTIASCEDWELGIRARSAGVKVLYNPAIVVRHNDWAVSLRSFCRRQMLYSISDVLLFTQYGELSPRAEMIRQNSPVDWGRDSKSLIARKSAKKILAARPCRALLRALARLAELAAPDSAFAWKLYEIVIGVAIFRGVREGLRRYGSDKTLQKSALRARPVHQESK